MSTNKQQERSEGRHALRGDSEGSCYFSQFSISIADAIARREAFSRMAGRRIALQTRSAPDAVRHQYTATQGVFHSRSAVNVRAAPALEAEPPALSGTSHPTTSKRTRPRRAQPTASPSRSSLTHPFPATMIRGSGDKAEDRRRKAGGLHNRGFWGPEIGFPPQSASRQNPTAYSLQPTASLPLQT